MIRGKGKIVIFLGFCVALVSAHMIYTDARRQDALREHEKSSSIFRRTSGGESAGPVARSL